MNIETEATIKQIVIKGKEIRVKVGLVADGDVMFELLHDNEPFDHLNDAGRPVISKVRVADGLGLHKASLGGLASITCHIRPGDFTVDDNGVVILGLEIVCLTVSSIRDMLPELALIAAAGPTSLIIQGAQGELDLEEPTVAVTTLRDLMKAPGRSKSTW